MCRAHEKAPEKIWEKNMRKTVEDSASAKPSLSQVMRRTGNKDSLKGLQKGKCTDSKPCVISYFMKHNLPTQFWLP